jgi:hypothetical protein
VVPLRGRLFNFTHASRPLIFHCLQFFRRSCQEGRIFRGRSLTVFFDSVEDILPLSTTQHHLPKL